MIKPKRQFETTVNMRLAQWRVTWLIEHSTSHQHLLCIELVLKDKMLRNSLLSQATKHYVQSIRNPKFED